MSAFDRPREIRLLKPGEVFAGSGEFTLSVVVGTSVSVCLWEPESRVGGMNHYLRPWARWAPGDLTLGVRAIPELVNQMRTVSGRGHGFQASLFGGARVSRNSDELCEDNLAIARDVLDALGIPIIDQAVGGTSVRRVVFDLETGRAHVR